MKAWLKRPPSKVAAAALVVALAAGAVWWQRQASTPATSKGAGAGADKPPQRPVSVVVAPVRKGDIAVVQTALGTVVARTTVTVRTQVDGVLQRVLFQEGQSVKAGTLLAEIDPRPFQAALKQAQGQLERDRALLRNAEIDLQRYRTLIEQDSIARQQFDTQEALVRQYQGVVQADQGQVDTAKLQLDYTRISAPFDGRVGLRLVDPGNVVHPGDAGGLFVLTQTQPSLVVFPVPQDQLGAFERGLRRGGAGSVVEAWDRENRTRIAVGRLDSIDNQIDTATGTVKIKALFRNQDNALYPNQFVNARTVLDHLHDAVLMPTAAVQRGVPGTFVYVVRDDKTVTVRPVKLGAVEGETVAVESGLAPGERVVVDGADKLRDGARVEIAGTPPARGRPGQGAGNGGAGNGGAAGAAGNPGTGAAPEGKRGAQPGAGAARANAAS